MEPFTQSSIVAGSSHLGLLKWRAHAQLHGPMDPITVAIGLQWKIPSANTSRDILYDNVRVCSHRIWAPVAGIHPDTLKKKVPWCILWWNRGAPTLLCLAHNVYTAGELSKHSPKETMFALLFSMGAPWLLRGIHRGRTKRGVNIPLHKDFPFWTCRLQNVIASATRHLGQAGPLEKSHFWCCTLNAEVP